MEIFIRGSKRSVARATHGALPGRSTISLDHFDRAGSPLCVYYVFIMADYQEPSDKTSGASVFCFGPAVLVPRTVPPPPLPSSAAPPPLDSLIDTAMLVQSIMVVQAAFNETSILECDRPSMRRDATSREPREADHAAKIGKVPRQVFFRDQRVDLSG